MKTPAAWACFAVGAVLFAFVAVTLAVLVWILAVVLFVGAWREAVRLRRLGKGQDRFEAGFDEGEHPTAGQSQAPPASGFDMYTPN